MGVVFRQTSATTLISYLGVLIGYFNVLWLFPAILSAQEIGLLRLLPSMAFLLLPFTQLGLSQSVLKFYPEYDKKPEGKKELLSFMLFANTLGFGITLVVLSLFQEQIKDFFSSKSEIANSYLHVTAVLIFILSIQSIFESFARSILKIIYPGVIKDIVLRLLYTALVIAFFFNAISLNAMINGLIFIYLIALLLLVGYVLQKSDVGITIRFITLRWLGIRSIFSYSVFAFLGASGNYIILNIDQLMVSSMIGLEGNGIYTTAFYIALVIEMPRRAMSGITTPLVSKYFQEEKLSEINQLYKQVSINQMVVGSLLLTGILVNIQNIFALIPNNDIYIAGTTVVFIIGIAKLLNMAFGNSSEIILMSSFYKYNVYFTIGLGVVAILSNWILIKFYGINGAALATALTLVLYNVVKLIFIKHKLRFWPFRWNNLILLGIGLATYFIIVQMPLLVNVWIDVFIRSVLTGLLFIIPCLLFRISPEINQILSKWTGIRL